MYKDMNAYINLQIQWFDYIRSMSVYVQEQCIEDIVATYIVDVAKCVSCQLGSCQLGTVQLNKESQFGILHEVARLVYLSQHNEVLEHTQKIIDEPIVEESLLSKNLGLLSNIIL